jgi:hypothetical protein
MPNSSELASPAGVISGSFSGSFGGSDDYVFSNVDMLFDRSSSFSFSIFRIRARAARRGGVGSSKARRSFSPIPGQVRFNSSSRANKRTNPKNNKRAIPYLGYIRNALNSNNIN